MSGTGTCVNSGLMLLTSLLLIFHQSACLPSIDGVFLHEFQRELHASLEKVKNCPEICSSTDNACCLNLTVPCRDSTFPNYFLEGTKKFNFTKINRRLTTFNNSVSERECFFNQKMSNDDKIPSTISSRALLNMVNFLRQKYMTTKIHNDYFCINCDCPTSF